jgi:hypothetical protein
MLLSQQLRTARLNRGSPDAYPSTAATPAEKALVEVLKKLGIADPGKTLDAIREVSMRLEASQPELATHVREAQAVITTAGSQFVARVNGWFDPTMDRVSQSFTNHSRYWTAGVSLLLAVLLQIDTFKIVNRLSIDDALRASLLNVAPTVPPPANSATNASAPKEPAANHPAAPASNSTTTLPAQANDQKIKALETDTKANMALLQNLASDQLLTWPMWPHFWCNWWNAWDRSHISIFGVLMTTVLLSFGAPFWFNMLGDLLKLRPMLACACNTLRNDQERQDARIPT